MREHRDVNRWTWWYALALGTVVLSFAGAELFYGLGLPWIIGAAIGVVLAVIFSWAFHRLRERAILPVMNSIVSLMVIFQILFLWLNFLNTNTSAYVGLVSVGLLILIFIFTFAKTRLAPAWALFHEVINMGALIVVNFSWLYWNQSLADTSCMGEAITKTDSVYFTLTTLATVGYGDIHPVSEACRQLVSAQIIADFIFAGLIFSLFVSRIGQSLSSSADDQQSRAALSQVQDSLESLGKDLDILKTDLHGILSTGTRSAVKRWLRRLRGL